jgi:hypothetical protein
VDILVDRASITSSLAISLHILFPLLETLHMLVENAATCVLVREGLEVVTSSQSSTHLVIGIVYGNGWI